MALSPKETGKLIAKLAKHLTIKQTGIEKLSNKILNGIVSKKVNINNFSQNKLHPKETDPHAIDWIFLCDTLNFCFWTSPKNLANKWTVEGQTGYFALCAAINRAQKEGIDITNPAIYSKITEEEFGNILRSDNEAIVQLIPERVKCLHEVGEKLLQKYNGMFKNCILEAKNSAQDLLKLIVTEFPCFRDEAEYEGQRVGIYKRAQILIGDIWACFHGEGIGRFDDIETVTMFADYRIPQVLVHFDSLEYSTELNDLLKQDKTLPNGSAEEVEIRGASIYIVDQVKDRVLKQLELNHPSIPTKNVNSILIDHFLWDYRRDFAKELECIPFHRTICIYY